MKVVKSKTGKSIKGFGYVVEFTGEKSGATSVTFNNPENNEQVQGYHFSSIVSAGEYAKGEPIFDVYSGRNVGQKPTITGGISSYNFARK